MATLFVPLIKRSFSTYFKAGFGKLNFWRKIHSRGSYKNGENFVLSQNVLRKYFFGKILCSTHQKKLFYKLLGSFRKIEFLTENPQPCPLQKWWKFCIISKCAKKIFFWQHYLFHSSKEAFLQTFRHFSENWIFDRKSTAAPLTKMVKILYYLKMY